ncbi:MAG: hypothetical protein PHN31_03110 [Candidatus Gracilibacteria bacterium]|nr:hypothetical protein [Candidatus Gracilibacteria bacterium]
MPNYKFIASKNQKKYDLIIQSNSEEEGRERLHKEGYFILNVEKIDDLNILGNKFLFTINKNGEIKNGIIYGEDIFKVYLKLKKDFDYDVISLYNELEKNKTEIEKKEILKKIEEEYYLFINKDKKTEKEDPTQKKQDENILEKDFYLKKELEETYKLTDFVLKKIQNFINSDTLEIPEIQKTKLSIIYNNLVSIKNSKNISKLKEILELALIKIGKIELDNLEKTKNKKLLLLLKDTNNLLKQVGSKEQIIQKNKDVGYLLKTFFNFIGNFTISLFANEKDNKKDSIDKESHSYIKTLVLIKKYKEKEQETKKEIMKNVLFFWKDKEYMSNLFLKKAVIKQNLSILKAKSEGVNFSYTKITKGYKKIESLFLEFLNYLTKEIGIIIVFFNIIFLTIIVLNYFSLLNLAINVNGIKLIIYFNLALILSLLTRGFFSFIFYVVFFIFFHIFFVVNF